MIKRKVNVKNIFLIFLCGFALFVCGVSVAYDGFRFAKADSSAEQTEIDIATVCGTDRKIVKGAEVLGDTGKSKYYTIKARLYLGEDFDVTFYLNTDGTATNGRPFGGAIYIHFNYQCLSWGWPGAQGLLGMTGEGRNTEMGLEEGKTYDMEFGIKDNEGNIAGSKLHAFVKLNRSDWTEARIWEFEANIHSEPLFHGGFGTEIAVNSANAIVLETSAATCDHEISGWSEPDEKSEIYRSCKKCGIIMERSYRVNVVDFSTLTGEDSALLGGKGVLGELADRQAVAVKARVYLPEEEKFNFRFALFGDGKTHSDFGDLYGSFIYMFSEGSVEVKYPDGDTVDSVSCSALKAGETVCIEFGVYAMNDTEREFYVKVNDEKVLSGKGVDDNEPLGTSVTYNFIGAALTESATSACEHKEGKHSEPDESGFADVACDLCGKVLYRSHAQEVRDISEYIGNDAVLLEADRKVSYDLRADEYVALKGIMHIPEEAGNDFGIKFHLMSDAMAWQGSAAERFEGMFTWVLQNGDSTKATLYPSFPWAYGFYVGKDCSNAAIRAGSTFMFEVGVYRISSDYTVRTTYFKINGETVGEFSRFDNSNAYGSYIYLETDCDIVLTTAGSECSDGVHSIGNWSEADSSFKQKKTCEKCGKEIIGREVASNVRFSSNPIGLVRLDEMQAIGETFTYDIPIITGYKISGITVNGTDVTSAAEDLPYGYRITVRRDSLDIEIGAEYAATQYSVSYKYNTACSVKVEESRVGHGGTALYTIAMKNGNDITKASVNGTDVTEDLVKNDGGYTLSVKNITSDATLVIEAQKTNYAIDIEEAAGGKLTAEKTSVNAFGNVRVSVSLEEGYKLSYFLVNGIKTASQNGVLLIENVNEDMTVSAVFARVAEEKDDDSSDDSSASGGCKGNISSASGLFTISSIVAVLGVIFTRYQKKKTK